MFSVHAVLRTGIILRGRNQEKKEVFLLKACEGKKRNLRRGNY